tara:strand:- start:8708 stop:9172 length:465 start_codon:yes stop_codon:yes gene_type:complete
LKRINPGSSAQTKKSKKQMEAEYQTSVAILGMGYRASDHLLTRYKRAVLDDKEAEAIVHSDEDIDWISSITNDALIHSNVHVSNMFTPNSLAAVCNLYWFGKPLYVINAQAKRRPFSKVGRGILERLPFIGRRIRARREAAEREAVNVEEIVSA